MEFIIVAVLVGILAVIGLALVFGKKQNDANHKKIDQITNEIKGKLNQPKKDPKTLNLVDKTSFQSGIIKQDVPTKNSPKQKPMGWVQSSSYEEDVKNVDIEKYLNEEEEEQSLPVENKNVVVNKPTAHNVKTIKPLVLLVDDSITVLTKVGNLLSKSGYEVITKTDGWEAINYLQSSSNIRPDLIISDIEMPKLSGVELIKLIRKERRFNNIPVLIISAHAASHLELMEEELIQGFMQKPFDEKDFTQQVKYLLN